MTSVANAPEYSARRGRLVRPSFIVIAALQLLIAGCRTVPFYEKERLNEETMVLEEDPTDIHFEQKVLYSREGSAGGIGTGAGGGCGCY